MLTSLLLLCTAPHTCFLSVPPEFQGHPISGPPYTLVPAWPGCSPESTFPHLWGRNLNETSSDFFIAVRSLLYIQYFSFIALSKIYNYILEGLFTYSVFLIDLNFP